MLTALMVRAAVQAKGEKEQGMRASPKDVASPAQTCFTCKHTHTSSALPDGSGAYDHTLSPIMQEKWAGGGAHLHMHACSQTEQLPASNHSWSWQAPCAAALSAFGPTGKAREGKGYIAVPACGGSLTEAKRACNQTSPN
eukprot:1156410-Pelagomonas_calceolata.AAC.6